MPPRDGPVSCTEAPILKCASARVHVPHARQACLCALLDVSSVHVVPSRVGQRASRSQCPHGPEGQLGFLICGGRTEMVKTCSHHPRILICLRGFLSAVCWLALLLDHSVV